MTGETPIHWVDDLESLDAPPHLLPKYARVIFNVAGGKIAVHVQANSLFVTEQTGRRLLITPRAANAIAIESI